MSHKPKVRATLGRASSRIWGVYLGKESREKTPPHTFYADDGQEAIKARHEDTGLRTLKGMKKGLDSRWGDTESRLRKVRAFWEVHRANYPQIGINAMKLAAVKACGVSMTFINDYRRKGRLVIPPKR